MQLIRNQTVETKWIPRPNIQEDTVTNTQYTSPVKYTNYAWGPQSSQQIATQEFTAEQAEAFVAGKKRARSAAAVNKNVGIVQQNAGMFATSVAGFDLNLIMGGGLANARRLRFEVDEDKYYADGSIMALPPTNPVAVGTGLKIIGVEIMSESMGMPDDGRPFMQTYAFVAKDIIPLAPTDIDTVIARNRSMQQVTPQERLRVPQGPQSLSDSTTSFPLNQDQVAPTGLDNGPWTAE
jgi:hypothetical protein